MSNQAVMQHAHSTPDPDAPAEPKPTPVPDDVPSPANAPVEEPHFPEVPIKAGKADVLHV